VLEPSAPQPPLPQPVPAPKPLASTEGPALRLLSEIRAAQQRALWAQGLLLGLAVFLGLAVAGGYLGAVAPSKAQWVLGAAGPAGFAVALFFGVYLARRRVGDHARTARLLAGKVPELSLDILAAVELSRALGERHDFSPELARAFLRDVDARAARQNVRALIDPRPTRRAGAALLLGLAAVLGVLALHGARVRAGLLLAFSAAEAKAVVPREPITGDFELTYHYPAYTGLEARTLTGVGGDINGPQGTEVKLKTRADREVDSAALMVNGVRVPLTRAGRELAGGFVLDKPGAYHVVFLDGSKVVVEGPDMPIVVEPDRVPQVRLTAPVDGLELDPDKQQVTLKYEASDDYGLSSLELVFRPLGGAEARLALHPDEGRTSRGSYAWDVGALKLKAGKTVSYYLEAKDNDAVLGPKKGASQTLTLKIYSAEEHRREAIKKASALWERLVTHLADRMESAERKAPSLEASKGGADVDDRAAMLSVDFASLAGELDAQRDPPADVQAVLRNVGAELQQDTAHTQTTRRLYQRLATSSAATYGKEVGQRLAAAVASDVDHSEKNVLYLESLLDRKKMEALKDLAAELKARRRDLSSLLEQYKQTKDEKVQEQLLQQMQELKQRMQELQERMAELARGINDEHMNSEALQEMMEERDFQSALDDVERLVREGKADEAMKKMQELGMQLDDFLEKMDRAEEESDQQADPELAQKVEEFQQNLAETEQQQTSLAEKTKELRDKYREKTREKVAQQGKALKKELQKSLDELEQSYRALDADRFTLRLEEPRAQALQDIEQAKQALEANDFDLASDPASRLEQRAQEMAQNAEEQRRLDDLFGNPPDSKKASRALAEKLKKDSKKASEVAEKLRGLFPQGGSQMSEGDKEQTRELAKSQKQLEKKAQELQDQMEQISDRAPVFDEDAKKQLEQAGQHMGSASERLGGKDPGRGYGEQQGALQALRGLQQQMKEGAGKGGLPMPMRSSRNGRGGTQHEKVEIPDEDPNQPPREFRRDVMDVMKQGAPDRYKDQNKRYYEELVK